MSSQVTNLLFLILPWVIIITLIAVAIWLVRWFIRNDRGKTKDK
mgnify:CR=1